MSHQRKADRPAFLGLAPSKGALRAPAAPPKAGTAALGVMGRLFCCFSATVEPEEAQTSVEDEENRRLEARGLSQLRRGTNIQLCLYIYKAH